MARFVKLLDEELGLCFHKDRLEEILRLHALSYLATFFGFDPGYRYTLYAGGPYSTAMAEDYRDLSDGPLRPLTKELKKFEELKGFKGFKGWPEFRKLVYKMTLPDLEIAATLMFLWQSTSGKLSPHRVEEYIVGRTAWLRKARRSQVRRVLGELRGVGLVPIG